MEESDIQDNKKKILPAGFIKTDRKFDQKCQGRFILQTDPDGYLKKRLIELIHSAKSSILLSSFLINDMDVAQALRAKASREEIEVFVITAGTRIRSDQFEQEDVKSQNMIDELKKLLSAIGRDCLIRTASDFHLKGIVVDHLLDGRKGLLLTCNINKEPLVGSAELAVVLNKNQSKALGRIFSYLFWERSEKEYRRGAEFPIKSEGRFTFPENLSGLLSPLSSGEENLESNILDLVGKAHKSISICSFNWGHSKLEEILLKKLDSGCKVKLFGRSNRDKQILSLQNLLDSGAELYEIPKLHAKVVLADKDGIITTANLDKSSLKDSVEIGVTLNYEQVGELETILDHWKNSSPSYFQKSALLGDVLGTYDILDQDKRKSIEIIQHDKKELPSIEAECASLLANASRPKIPEFVVNESEILSHKTEFWWKVIPPSLFKKAKRIIPKKDEVQHPLPVYRVNNKFHIGIERKNELDTALKLKKKINATKIVWIGKR